MTTTATVTIDRNPLSLSASAIELDIETFRARLEDELSRLHPERTIRVTTGDVLGFESSDPELAREFSAIWLATAAELEAA